SVAARAAAVRALRRAASAAGGIDARRGADINRRDAARRARGARCRRRRRAAVRHPRSQGRRRFRGVERQGPGAAGGARAQTRAPRARRHHRRLPLRVHRPRPLRHSARRHGRQRRHARASGKGSGIARGRGRRHRGAERHDGRPRCGHTFGARRTGTARHGDLELCGQVRRPVSRRRRVDPELRRPAVVSDGRGERRRGAARSAARHRGGRGHGDGEAGRAVSRRDSARESRDRLSTRRVSGERRVRYDTGSRRTWLDRSRARDDGVAARHPARRRGRHHHLFRASGGGAADRAAQLRTRMKYRIFPGTSISVSEVGFGTWTISTGWWGEKSDAEAVSMLRRAHDDHGVTFFDAADAYGNGRAERQLADAFRGRRRDVVIATKVGYDIYDEQAQKVRRGQAELPMRTDPAFLRLAVDRCLERLETDYIDVLQLHNAKLEHVRDPEIWATLRDLQREGKILAWGAAFGPAIGWLYEAVELVERE